MLPSVLLRGLCIYVLKNIQHYTVAESKEETTVLLLKSINNRLKYKNLIVEFENLKLKRKWLGIF